MTLKEILEFLHTDIWRIRRKDLPRSQSLLLRTLRTLILTAEGLWQGRWLLRASALTYYSILSIVPAMAMLFGIAKGFGFEKLVEKQLRDKLAGQEEIVTMVLKFANALLENVRGGLMAIVGLILLFWALFRILSQIEFAFNDIWGVNRPREWGRRIIDYLALMLLFPFLIIISSITTVFITSEVHTAVDKFTILEAVSPFIVFSLKLLPYLALWILFTYLFVFMPNTKINLKSGLLAGIVAGTLWQLFQKVYINFQIGLSSYNTIYGSFAALPLFILWLYYSWLILLFGAEIACAHQNADINEFETDRQGLSHSFKKLLALSITLLLVRKFRTAGERINGRTIAQNLEAPMPLVNQVLYELVQAGIVSEIRLPDDETAAYQPAVETDLLTVKFVIDALEQNGSANIPLAQTKELATLSESLLTFSDLIEKSPANLKLKDI